MASFPGLLIAASIAAVCSAKCGDAVEAKRQTAASADVSTDSPARRQIVAIARKYIAIHWPDVDLRRWSPSIEFSKEDSFFKKPHWTIGFDGRPPIHSADAALFQIEYNKETVRYSLTLDEQGNRLAAVVIQQ